LDDFWEILRKLIEDFMRTGEIDPEKLLNSNVFFYGYTVTMGPDGKPVIREFGNAPGLLGEALLEDILVEVRDHGDRMEVLADLPGYTADEVAAELEPGRRALVVRAGPNVKRVELPAKAGELVEKSFRNGVLRLVFKKKRRLIPL